MEFNIKFDIKVPADIQNIGAEIQKLAALVLEIQERQAACEVAESLARLEEQKAYLAERGAKIKSASEIDG